MRDFESELFGAPKTFSKRFFYDEAIFGNANPAEHAMLEEGGATKLS